MFKAVRWVATRLQDALGWLQIAPRNLADTLPTEGEIGTTPSPEPAACAAGAGRDDAPSGDARAQAVGRAAGAPPSGLDTLEPLPSAASPASDREDLGERTLANQGVAPAMATDLPAEGIEPAADPGCPDVGLAAPAQCEPAGTEPACDPEEAAGSRLIAQLDLAMAETAQPPGEPAPLMGDGGALLSATEGTHDSSPSPEWPVAEHAASAGACPGADAVRPPIDRLDHDFGSTASPDCHVTLRTPSQQQAERFIALLEGTPIGCQSAGAEELMELLDDEEFVAIVKLIAASDRTFDDLRLPAAKHVYEMIMARPLRLREPVRFREPVHDLGVLQMLYTALREFAQTEGAPLIIPAAGITTMGPSGEILAHAAWWTCDALDQELKAAEPDLRAANGRVLARWFPNLEADVLQPARIATLTSAPKRGRKGEQSYGSSGGPLSDDRPTDASVIPGGVPAAAIWLRGHGTAAWTIRLAMSRGTRILDSGELDRVRREVEVAAWQRNLRHKVLSAVTSYVEDPHGYDPKSVKKRLARKDAEQDASPPFALGDEQAVSDAWRHARLEVKIPFDPSIGMPSVDVLAREWIAQIVPPFTAALGMACADPGVSPEPAQESYDLRNDAA